MTGPRPKAATSRRAAAAKLPAPLLFDRKQQFGAKRTLILAEAARLFNERGFTRCSIEDIADRLGIVKTAIYYYFRSKDEILYECYLQAFDIADRALDEAEQQGRNGRERLEGYVRSYLLNGVAAGSHILPLRDQKALPDELREKLDKRRRARRDRLRAVVAEGIADGSIRRCNPKIVVSAWAGTLAWILESYQEGGELSFAEIAEQLITVFMHGLATQPPG
jgi:AcrR family transcriptional regulator